MNNKDEDKRSKALQSSIHELKTHLTAIIASTDLLAEQLQSKSGDPSGRLLRAISRNASSMNKKLSQLSGAGGFNDMLQPLRDDVPVSQVIREISSLLGPIIRRRKQTLDLQMPGDLFPIQGNRQYISSILLSLVHNAIKFTPPGGNITVSASNDNKRVVIEVRDNGIGIPQEEWENIFELRRRLIHNQTSDTGSGIGLPTARFLVELHGGKLWLNSEVGKGSRFFVALPAAAGQE